MSEFVVYEDDQLRMRIPKYLNSKRGIAGYFEPRSEAKEDAVIFTMTVDFVDSETAFESYWLQFSANEAGKEWDIFGTKTMILKHGKSSLFERGIESLSKSYNSAAEITLYSYSALFTLGDRHIHVTVGGHGNAETFEEECNQIVSSIEVKPGGAKNASTQKHIVSGGLKRADRAKLTKALGGLPSELAYLRKPILGLAEEDQGLLGSGEGDIGPLLRALKKAAKSAEIEVIAATHTKALKEWLESLPDHGDPWATPVWFVVGALAGGVLFDPGEE